MTWPRWKSPWWRVFDRRDRRRRQQADRVEQGCRVRRVRCRRPRQPLPAARAGPLDAQPASFASMSSSPPRHSARSAEVIGSGAKSGSSAPCSAKARCICAVRRPSCRASARKKSSGPAGRRFGPAASRRAPPRSARRRDSGSDSRAPGSSRRPGCGRSRTTRRAPSAASPIRRTTARGWRAAAACWQTRPARSGTGSFRSPGAARAAAAGRP